MPEIYRCPSCGYTRRDAAIHMDHALCVVRGGPPMPTSPARIAVWRLLDGSAYVVDIRFDDGCLLMPVGGPFPLDDALEAAFERQASNPDLAIYLNGELYHDAPDLVAHLPGANYG